MKFPEWTKNITKRMVTMWAVSFAVFLVVAFGCVCLFLGVSPVKYGASINYDNVFSVEYMNANHSKQLFNKDAPLHDNAMRAILKNLESGGKTNKLVKLFTGNHDQVVENNNTGTKYTTSFATTYANNAIIISFSQPQYHVESYDNNTKFKLVTTATSTSSPVYKFLIPLDNTSNKVQEQTWFLLTYNPASFPSGQSLTLSTKITTYGNYKKLGEYVQDLFVRL